MDGDLVENVGVLGLMKSVSDLIKESEMQIQTNKRKLAQLQISLSEMEGNVYTVICLEKTPDGKPAFSNEKLREIELQSRLRNHTMYIEMQKEFDELDHSTAATLIPTYNHQVREFRILELSPLMGDCVLAGVK